ncbi:extracellular solute-binding protein [Streptomyces sp. 7-21]|jgi:multiple sugar transport system substrate-binding protein|uniref:extracellular solute-binding protein n=1 Tax=Streptomyces sp. 7-21 TaxID=2802283 RepID=UPI00191FEAD1|nr:extracellular solute-binding protein [Streptomyces sp. 7-21]MBL1068188.1 extracellular solute-binding protein [Streptomyces sp. 7-21]
MPGSNGPRGPRRRTLIAAAAAGAVPGCGLLPGGGSGGPDLDAAARVPRGDVTLNWWSFAMATHDGGDLRPLLIDAFREHHPNIRVEITEAPAVTDITRTTLTTTIASGAPLPDVYMGDIAWPAQFAHNAMALPLRTLVPDGYWQRYPEAVRRSLSYNGDVYAFPLYADQPYLFYRADLLDRHGLPVPETWEELDHAARTVMRAGDAPYGLLLQGAVFEGLTCNVAEFVADAGGSILSENGDRATFGRRAGERVFGYLHDAVTSGLLPSSASTFKEQDTADAFVGGEAVFLRNWAYVWGVVNAPDSPIAGKVGVAVRPGFEGMAGHGHGCLGGWCNFVNPHSKNLGAATAFARFCADDEAQRLMMRHSAYLPAVTALRESREARRSDTPVLALAADVRLVARPTQSPRYTQVSKALYTQTNRVLNGGATPRQAVAAARDGIEAALEGRSL